MLDSPLLKVVYQNKMRKQNTTDSENSVYSFYFCFYTFHTLQINILCQFRSQKSCFNFYNGVVFESSRGRRAMHRCRIVRFVREKCYCIIKVGSNRNRDRRAGALELNLISSCRRACGASLGSCVPHMMVRSFVFYKIFVPRAHFTENAVLRPKPGYL